MNQSLLEAIEAAKKRLLAALEFLNTEETRYASKMVEAMDANLVFASYAISPEATKNIAMWLEQVEDPISDFEAIALINKMEYQYAS